jgi:hypothetical protein
VTATVGDVELSYLPRSAAAPGAPAAGAATGLSATGPADRLVVYRHLNPQGNETRTGSFSCPGTDGAFGSHLAEGTLECKVVSLAVVEHPYQLEDVPLSRPPLKLDPPLFPGKPAPVSLAIPERTVSGTTMGAIRVINHCQKVVEEVRFQVRCLDAAGKRLATVPVLHPPISQPFFDGVVGPDSEAMIYQTTRLPRGTASATLHLEEVVFTDGTTWSPADKR